MIKTVFFDLDNTLCNSDTAWSIAISDTFQLLCKHAPNIREETVTKAWATVHEKLFQKVNAGKYSMAEVRDSRFQCLFEKLGLPLGTITEELNDFLSSRYLTSLRLYEDVTVLEKLHTYHVGIVTNGAHNTHTDSQFSKVKHLGLSERIQSLTISDEIGVRKPNIEIFKVACERAGVLPQEVVFVGDSIHNDIVGANRAEMTSVLINRKSDVVIPKIVDNQPDYSVSNLYDVPSCLTHVWTSQRVPLKRTYTTPVRNSSTCCDLTYRTSLLEGPKKSNGLCLCPRSGHSKTGFFHSMTIIYDSQEIVS